MLRDVLEAFVAGDPVKGKAVMSADAAMDACRASWAMFAAIEQTSTLSFGTH
jgi:hypothetical protein